jgi:hypothetical protein
MIFPRHCKEVGMAESAPYGEDQIYFLSRYLIRKLPEGGFETGTVELDEKGGLLRGLQEYQEISGPDETWLYPEKVILHDRADLIRKAADSGRRCTIFEGFDGHMTFVAEPDPSVLLKVHIYDSKPPFPVLSESVKNLERTGIFGGLEIEFVHHIIDIEEIEADFYPCRAAGFDKTLDNDRLSGGERIAGCLTARQMVAEWYGDETEFEFINICPLDLAKEEPFVARCCRSERKGLYEGERTGVAVHWGVSPKEICDAVYEAVNAWRKR